MKYTLILAALLAASPLEEKNAKTVADGISLCERSGCQPHDNLKRSCDLHGCKSCGTFAYLHGPDGNEVRYIPSDCERQFQDLEDKKAAAAEDQAIRAKYAPKDGGP